MSGSKGRFIFVVRDLSFGGINTVVEQLINQISVMEGCKVQVLALSKKNKQVSAFDSFEVCYLSEVVDGPLGIIARVINKFFPLLGSLIFCRIFRNILIARINELGDVNKIYLCGFGVYSNFGKILDKRFFYISHSIKSKMLRRKSKILLYANRRHLKKLVVLDRLVAVSKTVKNDWEKNILSKSELGKIRVIDNPINLETVLRRSRERIINERDYYLFCGRLSSEKNVIKIIDAIGNARGKSKLIIIGDGMEMDFIKAYIIERKLDEKVYPLGKMKNPYPYIKSAKALILFSDFEGMPMVALEAIALGTPLIMGECGGAAYDVIPVGSYGDVICRNDDKLLSERISFFDKRKPPIYAFDRDRFCCERAAIKYMSL